MAAQDTEDPSFPWATIPPTPHQYPACNDIPLPFPDLIRNTWGICPVSMDRLISLNNSHYILNTLCQVLYSFSTLSPLILTITQWGGYYNFTDKEIEAQRVWAICLNLLNSYISFLLIVPLWVAEMGPEFRVPDAKLSCTVLCTLPPSPREVLLAWSLSLPSSLEMLGFFLKSAVFSYKAMQERG